MSQEKDAAEERSTLLIEESHKRVRQEIREHCQRILDGMVMKSWRLQAEVDSLHAEIDRLALEMEENPAAVVNKYDPECRWIRR